MTEIANELVLVLAATRSCPGVTVKYSGKAPAYKATPELLPPVVNMPTPPAEVAITLSLVVWLTVIHAGSWDNTLICCVAIPNFPVVTTDAPVANCMT